MRGWDVDCGKSGRKGGVGGEEGEVEDQEDEAVFATIVGQREGVKTVSTLEAYSKR